MAPAITVAQARKEVEKALGNGEQVRFRYFTKTINAGSYDDDVSLTSGINVWTSGLHFPVNGPEASSDGFTQQFGRQKTGDIFMFVLGDIATSGSFKVGLGSPTVNEYSLVPDGVQDWRIAGGVVYKVLDLKLLTTGSLFGE